MGTFRSPAAKKRREAALRRQEKRWAAKASEVKTISADELPDESKLKQESRPP